MAGYKKIAIHSVPRSGSTWLGEIINSSPVVKYAYQPLFSYAHKGYLKPDCTSADIADFFDRLYHCEDDFTQQKQARDAGKLPHFKKSISNTGYAAVAYKEVRYHHLLPHMLAADKDLYVIALIRNPYSVINSWLRAPREFRADLGWDEMAEWRYAPKKNLNKPEEFNGFEKWREAAALFQQIQRAYPERVIIVDYDSLLTNPVLISKSLFSFCGLDYTQQTQTFLTKNQGENDHNSVTIGDHYGVFRQSQRDDAWKEQLNPEIIKEIEGLLSGNS